MSKLKNTLGTLRGAFNIGGSIATGTQGLVGLGSQKGSIIQQMAVLQNQYDNSWYRIQQELELERLRQAQSDQRFAGMFNGRRVSYNNITVKWSEMKDMIGTYPRKMLLLL